ncbi:MAG: flippase [Candidatus Nomurabacteria bacterium]|nr:MAG: flippase [Candidatus Nomurabacteria bacterium]
MSLAGQVGRNTILQFIGKVIGTALGFITVVLMLRYLSPGEYGYYTTVIAYLGFFSVVADLGLYLILVREISKPEANAEHAIGNILGVRIFAAVLLLGIGLLIAFLLPYGPLVRQGMVVGVFSFFFIAMNQLLVGIFQKHLAMRWVVLGEVAGRVVLLGGVMGVIALQMGLLAIIAAVVLGSATNFFISFAAALKYEPIRLRFDWPYWGYILKETAPLALSVVLNLLYFRLDTIFLSLMKPAEDVGLYGAAYKVLEILITFPNMFVGLLLPVLTATAFVQRERFIHVFQRSFDALLMATIPLIIGGFLIAGPLIAFISGSEEYAAAGPIFQVLIFAVGFLFLGSLSGHTIVAINAQRKMVWAYLVVAALGLISYVVLIPPFSYYGAAVGTVLTEFTIMFVGYWLIRRRVGFQLHFKYALRALAASIPMAAVIWLTSSMHVLVQVAFAFGVYAAALYLVKGFDAQLIRELLPSRFGGSESGGPDV